MPLNDSVGDQASRRTFLRATTGAIGAGTVGLAGCMGGGDGGDGSGDGGDGGDGGGTGGGSGDTGDGSGPEEEYPTDSINFVVAYSAGGGFDQYARLMEPYWEETLGAEFIVENIEGGGGVVGATQVYNAEPDGYTMMNWEPKEGLYPQIGGDVGFDLREMSHVGFFTQMPNGMNLSGSTNIQTWDELADNIDALNWGTQGQGSNAHMGPIILGELTGLWSADDVRLVHYNGTAEVLAGLERGEVNAFMPGPADSSAKVAQGLDASLFTVFGERGGPVEEYIETTGVEPLFWLEDLDFDNIDQFAEVTEFRRFVTGPPGVPDSILSTQQETFAEALESEDLLDEGIEAARPFTNPQPGTEPVEEAIDQVYDVLTQEPFEEILQNAMSG